MNPRRGQRQADPAAPIRVVLAGGGTGGHIYPALAVAEALRRLEPQARLLYLGTRQGLESRLVPAAGLNLVHVAASGYRGLGPVARVRFAINLVLGVLQSLAELRRFRPDVVLGSGGFVSLPVGLAARALRCPLALQEQNAIPGSTNRLLGRWASRVYLGFAEAAPYFPAGRGRDTGNPVRAAFAGALQEAPRAADGEGRPDGAAGVCHVLVFGGSRGARTLNRAVVDAARGVWASRTDVSLWAQTGPEEHEAVTRGCAGRLGATRIAPYIDDMPAALRWADVVVCRAGAMTLAELAAAGCAAVLVPYPHATDQHQLRNAKSREDAGAALLLLDELCTGESLAACVDGLRRDPARLRAMASAARRAARPDAAMEIAADLMRLAGRLPAGAGGLGADGLGADGPGAAAGR